MGSLGKTSYHTSLWGFYPFLSSFLEPLWPISFHFTFLLPLIVPVALLTHWTLPLSLGSHGPFTSLSPFIAFVGLQAHWTLFSTFFFLWAFALLLPFIVPVSLLVVISCHTGLLSFIFFFLSSLGFLWPICFYFAFLFFSSLLLLAIGPLCYWVPSFFLFFFK